MEYKKLGHIAKIQTGPFGSQLHQSDYIPTGIPCIMPCNIGSNLNIICDNIAYISEEDLNRLAKHKTQEGDIVYSRRGDIEKCAYISSRESGWLCGTGCLKVSIDSTIALPKYVAYLLSTPESKAWLVGNAVGTTMLNLNTTVLSDFPICLPDLDTQKKVVEIIDSIADKIELNKRINDNLEQQAQALYKSWFVDFEPFREGEFIESEFGLIPEGWRVGSLSDLTEITMGQSPSGKSYNETGDGMLFYQGRAEFGDRYPSIRLYTTEPSRIAEQNSVLLSVRAPVGDTNIAYNKCCIGRGLASITAKHGFNSFIFYMIKSLKDQFDLYNGEGTVFGSINRDSLNSMKVIVPTNEVINDFEKIVAPLDFKYKSLFTENLLLTQQRDYLLPKLMSGELKINEIDC